MNPIIRSQGCSLVGYGWDRDDGAISLVEIFFKALAGEQGGSPGYLLQWQASYCTIHCVQQLFRVSFIAKRSIFWQGVGVRGTLALEKIILFIVTSSTSNFFGR